MTSNIMIRGDSMDKETKRALELYRKDLVSLKDKVLQKREKELGKVAKINAELEETTEKDLEDLYSCGCISSKAYDKKLEQLREYKSSKSKDKPTALTEYLRMLENDIRNINMELKLDA